MRNGLSVILLAVGIVITCMTIASALFISDSGTTSVNQAAAGIRPLIEETYDYKLQQFENTTLSGDLVLKLARQYSKDYEVRVVTILYPRGFTSFPDNRKATDSRYVNEAATFNASLIRDANDNVIEIRLTQEGANFVE